MFDRDLVSDQKTLIQSLVAVLRREVLEVQVFETHISWILVAGSYAYKLKKAIRLDFLDFSTLDARLFYCQEELRLNLRLALTLYLDVVPITGNSRQPVIGGNGAALEYAVKMRAFPQQALWAGHIEKDGVSTVEIDALAQKLAAFHQSAAIAAQHSSWGSIDTLRKTADENMSLVMALAGNTCQEKLGTLKAWQDAQLEDLGAAFERRKAEGWIRECHGDLHAGNILTFEDQVVVFDCIEFNESLRWIDVINDLAFISMDLRFHGHHELAARLLNGYLQISGDYQGAAVLRYYHVQRALVRCKIALLRAQQVGLQTPDARSHQTKASRYLKFALNAIEAGPSAVILMHGYSGSGKSTAAGYLAEMTDALQIRSDVERKRLHGMAASDKAAAAPGWGLYSRTQTETTYDRLRTLASTTVEAGIPVIVDAACLQRWQRRLFEHLARAHGVPFFIIDVEATTTTLEARVLSRARRGDDPSDAGLEVLAHQLEHHEALTDEESSHAIHLHSDAGLDQAAVRQVCEPVLAALRRPAPSLVSAQRLLAAPS